MIIHKLVAQHIRHRDDSTFYSFQALDAIRWIQSSGVNLSRETRVLDLGCGHGIFGRELIARGCAVTFADDQNYLLPELREEPFIRVNLDSDKIENLGEYDLVVCSNVFEHLAKPELFLANIHKALVPSGLLYLSWTNWLSPWGGHEFSPFHYLGARRGQQVYDKLVRRPRIHTTFKDLFPTYIGKTLREIRRSPNLVLVRAAPRYYTEFPFILKLPLLREFLTWNCALLLSRTARH